jgi:hypothetical protein
VVLFLHGTQIVSLMGTLERAAGAAAEKLRRDLQKPGERVHSAAIGVSDRKTLADRQRAAAIPPILSEN